MNYELILDEVYIDTYSDMDELVKDIRMAIKGKPTEVRIIQIPNNKKRVSCVKQTIEDIMLKKTL